MISREELPPLLPTRTITFVSPQAMLSSKGSGGIWLMGLTPISDILHRTGQSPPAPSEFTLCFLNPYPHPVTCRGASRTGQVGERSCNFNQRENPRTTSRHHGPITQGACLCESFGGLSLNQQDSGSEGAHPHL